MISEYERAKILERSRRGKRHAARRGLVNVLSGAPFRTGTSRSARPAGRHVIRSCLNKPGSSNKSSSGLGETDLLAGSVPAAGKPEDSQPARQDLVDRTTVWGILKNPAYKGLAAFGKTRIGELRPRLRQQRNRTKSSRRTYSTYDTPLQERITIPVPALVSEDLFEAVREQLAENQKVSRQRKRGAKYLLQGLVVCDCCGYAYYGKPVSRASAKEKPPTPTTAAWGAMPIVSEETGLPQQADAGGRSGRRCLERRLGLLRNPEAVARMRATPPDSQRKAQRPRPTSTTGYDRSTGHQPAHRRLRRGNPHESGVRVPRIEKAKERLLRLPG